MLEFFGIDKILGAIAKLIWDVGSRIMIPMTILLWVIQSYLKVTLMAMLVPIGNALDAMVMNIDVNSINVNLAQVNSMFPIPEFLALVTAFLAIWAAVQAVKWVLKFIPTMG